MEETYWLEIITLVVSIIAIILSVIAMVRNEKLTKKITAKTLNTKFFEEVFFGNIIYNLPKSLDDISYSESEKKISNNYQNVSNIVLDILESALFYKHFDNIFYENIKTVLVEIDEKIVLLADMKGINKYTYASEKEIIDKYVDKLYSNFKDYYSLI